jgi:hypothetical protein
LRAFSDQSDAQPEDDCKSDDRYVAMKGNTMTTQNQPRQQNQSPGQKPGQQQGGGQKPGQQSQAPAKGDKNPKEPYDQTSDTDT